MGTGQISAADEPEAKNRMEKFVKLAKQYLASEGLLFRRAAPSVWWIEVFFPGQPNIARIDLQLPLELQFYQLGQQIASLKVRNQMDSNGKDLNAGQAQEPPTERTCLICGCTDSKACEGGCSWVMPEICSKCITDAVPECIELLVELLFETHRQPCTDTDCPTCNLIRFAKKAVAALRQ